MSSRDDTSKKKELKPSDILAEYGTWIWRTDFKKIVSKKLEISERRALDHIEKDPLIRKEERQGRRVYYGLKTWPMKEVVKVSSFFMKQAWQELAIISELNESMNVGNSYRSWLQLCGFIARLPGPLKEQLRSKHDDLQNRVYEIFTPGSQLYTRGPWKQNDRVRVLVRVMIDRVSTALHSLVSTIES